jgi:hypothetical protein
MSDCYIVVETQKSPEHPFETFTGHQTRAEVIAEFGRDPETPGGRTHYVDASYGRRWVAILDCPNRLAHG